MPGVQKHVQNESIATKRAHGHRVYVSGLKGQHSLQTGVAYHYRGHYIYAYPLRNPIQPVPFSTKKGINIIGTIQDLAPIYNPDASNLVPESSIAALNRSLYHVLQAQQEEEQESRRQVKQAIKCLEEAIDDADMEMSVIVRPSSHAPRSTHSQVSSSHRTPLMPSPVSSPAPSQWNSHISLHALAVLDARSNTGHPSCSPADEAKCVSEEAASYTPQQPWSGLVATDNPRLHRFQFSLNDLDSMVTKDPIPMFQRFASDPSGMVNLDVPAFSRAGSNTSLSNMTGHGARHDSAELSFGAGPGPQLYSRDPSPLATPAISRSVSRVGSHSALATTFTQDAYNGYSQPTFLSGLGAPRPSSHAGSHQTLSSVATHDDRASYLDASLGAGIGLQTSSRGPSPLGTSTLALSRTVSRACSPSALANLSIYDGTYYKEGSAAAADPGLLRSSAHGGSHPSLPSMAKPVGPEVPRNSSYVFGSTLAPLNAYMSQDFTNPRSFTPHDRALYLADSAPASHLPSVAPSRDGSPDRHLSTQAQYNMRSVASTSRLHQLLETSAPSSRFQSAASSQDISLEKHSSRARHAAPSTMRHVASTSRLYQLLAEEGRGQNSKPLSEGKSGKAPYTHPSTILSISRSHSPSLQTPTASPPSSRNKPIGAGRPRRASLLLNHVHNANKEHGLGSAGVISARVPKCVLHSEGCDGVSVSETWKTEWAAQTMGFREEYPMVKGEGGREFVDWARLVREEQEGVGGCLKFG